MITIDQHNIDAFLGAMERAIVVDQAIDLSKVAADAGIITDENRDYRNVSRYSEVDLEQQRDFLDAGRMKEAILIDASEPKAHKAWRRILDVHSQIRSALLELVLIKEASGKGYIKIKMPHGGFWYGRKEESDRIAALENLKYRMIRKAEAWADLYRAEGA